MRTSATLSMRTSACLAGRGGAARVGPAAHSEVGNIECPMKAEVCIRHSLNYTFAFYRGREEEGAHLTPCPWTQGWEVLADVARCRAGSNTDPHQAAPWSPARIGAELQRPWFPRKMACSCSAGSCSSLLAAQSEAGVARWTGTARRSGCQVGTHIGPPGSCYGTASLPSVPEALVPASQQQISHTQNSHTHKNHTPRHEKFQRSLRRKRWPCNLALKVKSTEPQSRSTLHGGPGFESASSRTKDVSGTEIQYRCDQCYCLSQYCGFGLSALYYSFQTKIGTVLSVGIELQLYSQYERICTRRRDTLRTVKGDGRVTCDLVTPMNLNFCEPGPGSPPRAAT
eukprot:1858975-Rhodomonas_salina.1